MIQQLISAGHRESDIWNYTLSKIQWYSRAIQRNDIDQIERLSTSIRLSFAKPQAAAAFMRKLRNAT